MNNNYSNNLEFKTNAGITVIVHVVASKVQVFKGEKFRYMYI